MMMLGDREGQPGEKSDRPFCQLTKHGFSVAMGIHCSPRNELANLGPSIFVLMNSSNMWFSVTKRDDLGGRTPKWT